MKMRLWLCAAGFASNWFNECILLPLIEHMPHVPPQGVAYMLSFPLAVSKTFSLVSSHKREISLCLALLLWRSSWFSSRVRHLSTDCFYLPSPADGISNWAVCVCVCVLSLQIGLWHSEDGLSMEKTLPSINVTDTLFNTTLTITTILVRATVCSLGVQRFS